MSLIISVVSYCNQTERRYVHWRLLADLLETIPRPLELTELREFVASAWIAASDFSLRRYQLDTVFSEQFQVAAKHSAGQLAKAEGYEYDGKKECVGFVHTFNFLEPTFNNSTNVDRLTTEFS